jgi:hypothetical protein
MNSIKFHLASLFASPPELIAPNVQKVLGLIWVDLVSLVVMLVSFAATKP